MNSFMWLWLVSIKFANIKTIEGMSIIYALCLILAYNKP